jgi:hypothetical protein
VTGEGNGRLPIFKIDASGQVANELKQILDIARSRGIEQDAKLALAVIFRRLRENPLGLGELVRELQQMKLLDHVAVVKPILVRFGISLEKRVVFISSFRLLEPGGVD